MITQARPEHPSNAFSRGEVTDFLEATRLYELAVRHEVARGYVHLDGSAGFWSHQLTEAQMARRIYEQQIAQGIDWVVIDLRTAKLDEWADALESGDYRKLAI